MNYKRTFMRHIAVEYQFDHPAITFHDLVTKLRRLNSVEEQIKVKKEGKEKERVKEKKKKKKKQLS